jgi:hypothetical protein
MDSYDRLFPSQDVLPRGGFGNLIALPLQPEQPLDDEHVSPGAVELAVGFDPVRAVDRPGPPI